MTVHLASCTFVAVVCGLLAWSWLRVPLERRGPRFTLLRKLNLAVIFLTGLAGMALASRDVLAGHLSFVGWPILVLLLGLSGFPRGTAVRTPES
jgi:hypothetical protein